MYPIYKAKQIKSEEQISAQKLITVFTAYACTIYICACIQSQCIKQYMNLVIVTALEKEDEDTGHQY